MPRAEFANPPPEAEIRYLPAAAHTIVVVGLSSDLSQPSHRVGRVDLRNAGRRDGPIDVVDVFRRSGNGERPGTITSADGLMRFVATQVSAQGRRP